MGASAYIKLPSLVIAALLNATTHAILAIANARPSQRMAEQILKLLFGPDRTLVLQALRVQK